jgi:hypothetical protein
MDQDLEPARYRKKVSGRRRWTVQWTAPKGKFDFFNGPWTITDRDPTLKAAEQAITTIESRSPDDLSIPNRAWTRSGPEEVNAKNRKRKAGS